MNEKQTYALAWGGVVEFTDEELADCTIEPEGRTMRVLTIAGRPHPYLIQMDDEGEAQLRHRMSINAGAR